MVEHTSTGEISGARVLESLQEALAAWPDLGIRTRVGIDQWSSLTADEVRAYQDVGISAVRSVAGGQAVSDQIRALGRLRHEPSVPTLIGLWEQCPVHPVAVAAAHALFEIGTAEARDTLRKGIHDHEYIGRFMALKVMFTDEGAAWDNVSHLFADEWQDESADVHPEIAGPLELTIGADYLHKANISGGAPYSVWLPHTGADPLVREEEHFLSFTDYLRRAFAGKGFLRLDRQDERVAHGLAPDRLAELTGWLASVEYEHTDF